MYKWGCGMAKLSQTSTFYLDIHMAVLCRGFLSWSCHSGNVDPPSYYNDPAILTLKVFWFNIQPHFKCTNTTLPTRAWYVYVYVLLYRPRQT